MKRLIATALVVASASFAAGCGESPEDNARDAGETIGENLQKVQTATSAADAGQAIDDINAQVANAKEDLPTALGDQVTAISEQFVQDAKGATDRAGLRAAYLEAASQFNSLASDTNSVINEFRRGVREGLADE